MSLLRGSKPILKRIWGYLLDLWKSHIVTDFKLGESKLPYACAGTVKFPAPSDIVINMMLFIFHDLQSLPKKYRGYWPIIERCTHPDHRGKVGYLTIHESWVKLGESQRRPGIHTESPGFIEIKKIKNPSAGKGKVDSFVHAPDEVTVTTWSDAWNWYEPDDIYEVAWGGGINNYPDGDIPERMQAELKAKTPKRAFPEPKGQRRFQGGIFMASNISNTCEVYAARIRKPVGVVGPHGDLEHISTALQKYGTKVKANHLIWMTDLTPHASLPIIDVQEKNVRRKKGYAYRQYFRLVGPDVTVWYKDHSTPNPRVQPGGATIIMHGNKFNAKGKCV